MRSLLAAITGLTALVLGTATFAEAPTPSSPPTLEQSPTDNCAGHYYPASAIRAGEQGSVLLNLSIDETGKVTKVEIAQSSGFAVLDKAATDCVLAGWHFRPALKDGKPVASAKEFRIVWRLAPTSAVARLQTPMESVCAGVFSDTANRWTSYKSATLQFRISAEGTVLHPFVALSSGDDLFDAKSVQCVARLKYSRPMVDGVPTEYSWSSAVRWSPQTGLAYADGYKLGLFCADTFFPANLWNGNPPDGTVISFHVVQGGAVASAAIERSSGNPALDQAALQCVRDWKMPFASLTGPSVDFGEIARVDFKDGHAFVLLDTAN